MGQPPENRRAAAARAILRGARIWALPLLLAVACTESPSMRTPSPTVTSATRTVATPIAVPTPSAAIKRFVPFDISEPPGSAPPVTPFTNIARQALVNKSDFWNDYVWNYRPGVAIFDYDRDGDLDFYLTSESGQANFLYRNDGGATFVDVAGEAGVVAVESASTGVVACDVNNDGYQDLYVGAQGPAGQSSISGPPSARMLRPGE